MSIGFTPRILLVFVYLLSSCYAINAGCPYDSSYVKITDGITYTLSAKLDPAEKKVIAKERIQWKNKGNVPVKELRMYMYMNSFKNMNSTFLKGSNGNIFGSDITNRKANEWGYINISNVMQGSKKLSTEYIQPDDGNIDDQSVIKIKLDQPIKPGETADITMDFVSKLPKFIARSGYSRDDFYAFLHWFPQLGVYEKNKDNKWDWNCHQFFRQTEFFADFSTFNVSLDLPSSIKLAHTGCITSIEEKGASKIWSITAHDVIDFAWVAYPHFMTYSDNWKGVDIKILYPPEHQASVYGYIRGLKNSLEFFEKRIGKYPYPSITLMDPPMHGLGSGFMEYPMMITSASFHWIPNGIRTVESLGIHEFSHQYFMGIVASNEKEEAWLDEGFVTFFEDEIMDHYHGNKTSIFDLWGFRSGNHEQSRLEYTNLKDAHPGIIARPGWDQKQESRKGIIYSKTSLILQTLKCMVGEEEFYKALRKYYESNKYAHPKEKEFIGVVKESLGDNLSNGMNLDKYFYQALHTEDWCDYYIDTIGGRYIVKNFGTFYFPIDVAIKYQDGSTSTLSYNTMDSIELKVDLSKKIYSIDIDPKRKIRFDKNYNNNSILLVKETNPSANFAMKSATVWQFLIHTLSYLL
jgi:hypothetical protein